MVDPGGSRRAPASGQVPRSVEGDRIPGGAGPAHDLERGPHEQELIGLVSQKGRELEVLDVPDPAARLQLGVALVLATMPGFRSGLSRTGLYVAYADALGQRDPGDAEAQAGAVVITPVIDWIARGSYGPRVGLTASPPGRSRAELEL
jgi:hypothetical protein